MLNLPIKKQVCTLEQAKRLTVILGDDAPGSLWVWIKYACSTVMILELLDVDRWDAGVEYYFPAYTGDELGVLLPFCVEAQLVHTRYPVTMTYGLIVAKWNDEFTAKYEEHEDVCLAECEEKTEAQAKAALAIQGLTEGWIKNEDFNYG